MICNILPTPASNPVIEEDDSAYYYDEDVSNPEIAYYYDEDVLSNPRASRWF
jgi:hypothetical protein